MIQCVGRVAYYTSKEYQNEVKEEIKGVNSRHKVKHNERKERLLNVREDDVGIKSNDG